MHAVEILALDDVVPFDLAAPLQVFDWVRLPDGRRPYRVRVCAETPEVRGDGVVLRVDRGLDALRTADTVIVPGCNPPTGPISPAALDALRAVAAAGTRIASVCSGAFVLAAAGLLAGLPATTHWAAAAELARLHPEIDVRPDVLYVDNGQILTSAGAAASLDMCLHLVRRDHGSAVAADSARRAVVPLEREGGQAQFIVHDRPPVPRGSALEPVLEWIGDHLADEITLGALAARAGMSERTFSRRFREQTGTTPLRWLLAARVRRAQYLLESGDQPVERVARQAGFGSPTAFRERFRQVVGTSPRAYRAAFRGRSGEGAAGGPQTASGSPSSSPLGAVAASSSASAAATASSTVVAPVSAHSA
ncbi:helix-turn-helix domain-containing protein [Streptomyces sp. DSM 41014]|uniref:Helix-turn-helix domain-containing protein n=1 Tax=Streptomyces hintoniae TaxID=3075521 RepID=A0ABU2UG17_9ACTN|nr:helix-turn-helix domain-containing protein [Streptomyces sp. DSM 41014]MDT0472188.1 helix-turn-helix domain-containing protein [Streptomyces sp. DSM 41014]